MKQNLVSHCSSREKQIINKCFKLKLNPRQPKRYYTPLLLSYYPRAQVFSKTQDIMISYYLPYSSVDVAKVINNFPFLSYDIKASTWMILICKANKEKKQNQTLKNKGNKLI